MLGGTRIASLLVTLIAATAVAFADDVDWKLVGGASVENTPELCFFDAKSVIRESGARPFLRRKCSRTVRR
jgi:hypothetical protein